MRKKGYIITTILFMLLGIMLPSGAAAQGNGRGNGRGRGRAEGRAEGQGEDNQDRGNGRARGHEERGNQPQAEQQAATPAPQPQPVEVQPHPVQPAPQVVQQAPAPRGDRDWNQTRGLRRPPDEDRQRVAPPVYSSAPVQAPPPRMDRYPGERLARERQEQLINEQQRRVDLYRQRLEQQRIAAQRYDEQLRRENRMRYYRIQQEYAARLRQQQLALQRSYNYRNDPYFYTAPSYRYQRGGTYYQVNEYGADLLRQAVNYGYQEGFRAGQADRLDGWRFDYRNSYAYRDANYGYSGYYLDEDTYNYYFREGFQRGYDDGYYSRARYGTYSNGVYNILGTVLTTLLNLQALR